MIISEFDIFFFVIFFIIDKSKKHIFHMISLLVLAIVIMIMSILLLANASVIIDSTNYSNLLTGNQNGSIINIWAMLSILFGLIGLGASLWLFWAYFTMEDVVKDVKITKSKIETGNVDKVVVKSDKLMNV